MSLNPDRDGPFRSRENAMRSGTSNFPTRGGVLLGLGLGGFFDGIVMHQILQWHHMVTSAGHPADSVENLQFNTLLDGLFHLATYVFTVSGLIVLWRAARRPTFVWSTKWLVGAMLIGFGLFNLAEGLVNHQILSLHHVNETVPREQWIYWDLGFLAWGALMLFGGLAMIKRGLSTRALRCDAPAAKPTIRRADTRPPL